MAEPEASEKDKKKEEGGLPEGAGNSPPEEHNHKAAATDAGLGSTDSVRLARNPTAIVAALSELPNVMKNAGGGGLITLGLAATMEGSPAPNGVTQSGVVNGTTEVKGGPEIKGGETGNAGSLRAGGAVNGFITAYSIYNGITELKKSENGLTTAAGIYNLGVGGANLYASGLQIAGRELPTVADTALKGAGLIGVGVGAGINIYNAKPEDRAFVAGTETIKGGVGFAAAGVGESIAVGAGLTGATAAALPIVVAAGAVIVVDQAAEKVADQRKDYREFQKNNEEQKKASRDEPAPAGKAPTPGDYRNLLYGEREASNNIDWSKIKGAEPPKGPIKIDLNAVLHPTPEQAKAQQEAMSKLDHDLGKSELKSRGGFTERSDKSPLAVLKIDLSIPENRKEVGRAIDVEIAKQKQVMAENGGVATYLRTSDGILAKFSPTGGRAGDAYKVAEEKLAHLQGAKNDLAQYDKDLKAFQDAKAKPAVPSAKTQFQNAAAPAPPAGSQPAPVTVTATGTIAPVEPKQASVGTTLEPPVTVSSTAPTAVEPSAIPVQQQVVVASGTSQGQASGSTPATYDPVEDGRIKTDVNMKADFQTAASGQTPVAPQVVAENNNTYTNNVRPQAPSA